MGESTCTDNELEHECPVAVKFLLLRTRLEPEKSDPVSTPRPRHFALLPQDPDVNARPIVRADCIKFVYTFRNQFSVEQLLALMPMLIAHLQSEHVSVVPSSIDPALYNVL